MKQIAAKGFSEARDLVGCLAILREGDSYAVKRAIESAKAALAANIVQRALLQRMLMTVERAFAPHHRKSDHHARVAFELLSNQTIFDEVATAGSRKPLEQACASTAIIVACFPKRNWPVFAIPISSALGEASADDATTSRA